MGLDRTHIGRVWRPLKVQTCAVHVADSPVSWTVAVNVILIRRPVPRWPCRWISIAPPPVKMTSGMQLQLYLLGLQRPQWTAARFVVALTIWRSAAKPCASSTGDSAATIGCSEARSGSPVMYLRRAAQTVGSKSEAT